MSIFGLELFYTVFHNCKSLHTHLCTLPDTSWHSHNDIPENNLQLNLTWIICLHILPLCTQSYSCLSLAFYNFSHTQCQFQHPQSSHTFGTPMITKMKRQWFNDLTISHLDYPGDRGFCWDRLAVRHRHFSADLLGYFDTFCHLLVLALVLRDLLTNLLGLVFAHLLRHLRAVAGWGPVARLVGGSALLLVNCLANFFLFIFANIIVDGFAFLLQLFFAF